MWTSQSDLKEPCTFGPCLLENFPLCDKQFYLDSVRTGCHTERKCWRSSLHSWHQVPGLWLRPVKQPDTRCSSKSEPNQRPSMRQQKKAMAQTRVDEPQNFEQIRWFCFTLLGFGEVNYVAKWCASGFGYDILN